MNTEINIWCQKSLRSTLQTIERFHIMHSPIYEYEYKYNINLILKILLYIFFSEVINSVGQSWCTTRISGLVIIIQYHSHDSPFFGDMTLGYFAVYVGINHITSKPLQNIKQSLSCMAVDKSISLINDFTDTLHLLYILIQGIKL